jgi:YD repeat-containing protein
VSITDASGRVTTLKYLDGGPRVESITAPGDRITSFTWNERGQLATTSSPGGIETGFGYSPQGRLRLVSDLARPPQGDPMSSQRVSWWFTHDPQRGLPTQVSRGLATFDPSATLALTLPLDPSANVYETRTFDADGHVSSVQPPMGPGETGSIRYFHDGFGNLWKREVGPELAPDRTECYLTDPRHGALVSVRFSLDTPTDPLDTDVRPRRERSSLGHRNGRDPRSRRGRTPRARELPVEERHGGRSPRHLP